MTFALSKPTSKGSLFILLGSTCFTFGQDLFLLDDTIVDPSALNFSDSGSNFNNNVNGRTYQRHPMTTFKGYQYTTYYDSDRQVCLARRKLPDGAWQVLRFADYNITSSDSHNSATVGICHADGTIHLAFDHHADPLNYRVSLPGVATNPESITWNTALFGEVSNTLGSIEVGNRFTYPTFINSPNGNLLLYYRDGGSGNGDGALQEYDGSTGEWVTGMGTFISRSGSYSGVISNNSNSRCPYINGISFAGNRLHASWGWRESSNGSSNNHDLNYAYSDDHGRTWFNSGGTQIGTIATDPISIDSPGLIVAPIPQNNGLSNQYTHFTYPDGSVHVMVAYNEAETGQRRYHHHWRTASGTWDFKALPFKGSRPKLVGEDNGNLFLAYANGGNARIAKGIPNATQTDWTWTEIHTQSDTTEGGEGHIDFTRWQNENVLTTYGQVRGNSNGDPTPLHIRDYQVSKRAVQPIPYHDSCEVVVTTPLQWTAGLDAVAHRVFFGSNEQALTDATLSSPEFQGEQSATSFVLSNPLAHETTYFWRIDQIDANGEVREGQTWKFTTAPAIPPVPNQSLFSLASDASIRELGNVVDIDNPSTLLGTGGSAPRVDRCTIYVFQLPNLGAHENPFSEGKLQIEYFDKDNDLVSCDLYGLGRRDMPDVLPEDYYGMTDILDETDATLLQSGIMDNNTPFGLVTTSPTGGINLTDYLNTEYEGGAGAGKFVFLRLNTAEPKNGIDRAALTMSDGGVVTSELDSRPQIQFYSNLSPTAEELWRFQHFATVQPVASAAPDSDPDLDGESNLLEFATGQNPLIQNRLNLGPFFQGDFVSIEFPRSHSALLDGIVYEVQWSNTLLPESWNSSGVSYEEVGVDSFVSWMSARFEPSSDIKRFYRLKVSRAAP